MVDPLQPLGRWVDEVTVGFSARRYCRPTSSVPRSRSPENTRRPGAPYQRESSTSSPLIAQRSLTGSARSNSPATQRWSAGSHLTPLR